MVPSGDSIWTWGYVLSMGVIGSPVGPTNEWSSVTVEPLVYVGTDKADLAGLVFVSWERLTQRRESRLGAKVYKGPLPQRRYDGSEVFDNLSPRTIATLQTYPGMVQRNIRSVDAEHVALQFYQQLRSGRRCTCWGSNTNASGSCEVCYGTGIVGGFLKYGCAQWILDATAPNLTLNNISILMTKQEGPHLFGLAEGAVSGEIIIPGDLQGNWGRPGACPREEGPVDVIDSQFWEDKDGQISFFIRSPQFTAWRPLTKEHLTTLLQYPQRFDVRITMQRPGVEAETPLLQHLMLRVFRTNKAATQMKANRPRGTHAQSLAELGVLDEWTSERWWFESRVPNLTDLDWFLDINRNIRWKAVDTDKMAPQDVTLSWDVTVRKVQDFEQRILKYPA